MSTLQEFVTAIGGLINLLLPLSVGAALLFFFWGLAIFVRDSGDGKKTPEGRQKMIWGVVILFVMVSVWGIVRFLQEDVLNLVGGNTPSRLSPRSNQ